MNARLWNIDKVMLAWTAFIVVGLIANVLGFAMAAPTIQSL